MIQILFGDYGTGKSTHILNRIKVDYENRVRSYLIVPEQETVIKERQIASLLPSGAQLFCEVSNFTRLANSVFREIGGLKTNYVSKSGKNLIMYQAICECRDDLMSYKISKGHEKGCIKLFLEAIGEFKSYSVSIEMLNKAIDILDNEGLKARLKDIILVWTSYEKILSKSFSDPYDRISLLAKAISNRDFFKGTNVYFDSFYGFTLSQFELLEASISSAENVTFAFDCPRCANENTIQFAKIAKTAKNVIALCKRLGKEYEIIEFTLDHKHKSEDLKILSKSLWDFSKSGCTSDGNISLIKCSDEFEECEFVASKICKLIRENYKYSEIAIIARNLDTYRGILDYTLKKYNIPHFLSASSDWLSKPIIKMIFSALSFVANYRGYDIVSYAKCGYTTIGQKELDDFESYITRWNISGKKFKNDDYWASNPDGFVEKPTSEQEKRLEGIISTRDSLLNSLKGIEDAFSSGTPTIGQCCSAIFEFLTENKILEKLEVERKEAEKADAYIISQAWQAILDALDTLYSVCKDTCVDINTFITLLHLAFIDAKVGTIPTGEDNVLIAEASLVRAQNIEHVFILGANEGVFPANVTGGSIFTDADKIALETVDINLSEKSDIRADDELMFFKNSIATASHSVTICSLTTSIDGSKGQESLGFKRISELFSNIKPIDASKADIFERIYSPELAREYLSLSSASLSSAISNELSIEKPVATDFSNELSELSNDTINTILGTYMSLSQTKMDTFVTCKFKYYSSYLLSLRSQDKHHFSSREAGTLVHSVFEHFLDKFKNEREALLSLNDDAIKESVDAVVSNYINIICKGAKITNRLNYLFDRLKRFLYIFVKKLVDEFRYSKFTPEYLELPFYHNRPNCAEPLSFKLKNGATVCLNGIADRVDTYRVDGKTYVRVADYKIGSKNFSERAITDGDGLQLLIYLYSLSKMRDCEFKKNLLKDTSEIVPAGFFYIPLNVGKVTSKNDLSSNLDQSQRNESEEIISASAFKGRFLDDDALISAQDPSPCGIYLPSTTSKSKSTYYISLEKFEELYEKMVESIISIGDNIYSGKAYASPKQVSGEDACAYCDQRAFCRRRNK